MEVYIYDLTVLCFSSKLLGVITKKDILNYIETHKDK